MQLSKKLNVSSWFGTAFLKSNLILNLLEKNVGLISYVFPILETTKDVLM